MRISIKIIIGILLISITGCSCFFLGSYMSKQELTEIAEANAIKASNDALIQRIAEHQNIRIKDVGSEHISLVWCI